MRLFEFRNEREYIDAQRKVTLTKASRGVSHFASRRVINLIENYHTNDVASGLCHGVRWGAELKLFRKRFGGGKWIGTEVVEELCDDIHIIHKDFHEFVPEWLGKFDIIYSNSLDHSHTPELAIGRWLEQLSPNGLLYVEWSRYHDSCGRGWNRADCFSASKVEYIELTKRCGTLVDVIHVMRKKRFVFVVAPDGGSNASVS